MRRLALGLLMVLVCVVTVHAETVYYHAADGAWKSLDAPAGAGYLRLSIPGRDIPAGHTAVVLRKPEWMVLEDTAAPVLTGLKVNGKPRPVSTDILDLGCMSGTDADVVLGVKDDLNPLMASPGLLALSGPGIPSIEIDASGIELPRTSGRISIALHGLEAGQYEGMLTVRDMAPLSNALSVPVRLRIVGASVSDDLQTVRLVNSAGEFGFSPGTTTQIRLPTGNQLYLTGQLRGYVYPLEFTEAAIVEQTMDGATVRVASTVLQDNHGEPVEAGGALMEYELTTRPDTPCLLVRSRVVNTGEDATRASSFWGWLPGAHFVTPDGAKHEWQGATQDRYIEIGTPGWLWLPPRGEGEAGLFWAAAETFTETRFDTMILHSAAEDAEPGGYTEARFAIGLARSFDDAQALYADLVSKGLVEQPAAGEGQ